jgi:hypothetical protein
MFQKIILFLKVYFDLITLTKLMSSIFALQQIVNSVLFRIRTKPLNYSVLST